MAENKSIKGTQTEKNLMVAYISESMAYSRYTFYAKQANKESYFPIEKDFNDTALNELHHAKVFFKLMQQGNVTVDTITVAAGPVGDTAANLAEAAREELEEGSNAYEAFAKVADEEGFKEIASHFRAIAKVERTHRRRFLRYLEQVKAGTVWRRDKPILWECLVCGYIHKGTTPPKVCPGCDHPYQHYIALDFEVPSENPE